MLPHSLHFNLIKILKLFAIFSGADTRGRTGDLILTKNALCQLSYIGAWDGSLREPSHPLSAYGAGGGIRTPEGVSHLVYSETHLTALVPQHLSGAGDRD